MPRMPLFFTEYLTSGCGLDGSAPLLCQLSFSFDLPHYLLIHDKKRKEGGWRWRGVVGQILMMAPASSMPLIFRERESS